MRPIKFRAWDKHENRWYEPIFRAYENEVYELLITFSGELERRTMQPILEHESLFPERYELMQFTGLYDKSGKEIYEGDIVQYQGQSFVESIIGEHPKTHVSEIKWHEEELKWALYHHDKDDWTTNLTKSGDDQQFEVIGNIYENSDLLKNA